MSDLYDDGNENDEELNSLSGELDSGMDESDNTEEEPFFEENPTVEAESASGEEPDEEEEEEPDYSDLYDDDLSGMYGEDDEGDGDDDDDDDMDDDYDIDHPGAVQDREILDSEEEELKEPVKNDAFILDRKKITLAITAFAFVLLIVFLMMPSSRRRTKKNDELEKAGMVYIPSEIDRWTVENGNIPAATAPTDEKPPAREFGIPGVDDEPPRQQGQAPVEVPRNLSGKGDTGNALPETNRNEQQKAFFNVSLDSVASGILGKTAATGQGSGTGLGGAMGSFGQTGGGGSYTPSSLQSNLSAYLSSQGGSSYEKQNNQSGKLGFMEKSRGAAGAYQWNSDFSLWKGTVIPAVLDTGINTNLPGQVIATVTENVFSSNNGNYILIPQGSRLFADYNSSISYGQDRVQVIWNTLIRPDGLEINLGNANGVDPYGFAGYKGSVSNHPFQYLKALGLIAMFSVLDTKMNKVIDTTNNQYAQNAISDAYTTSKRISEKIIDRALDIQPTLTIQPGTKIDLITNVTMELPPIDPYPVEAKYRRTY